MIEKSTIDLSATNFTDTFFEIAKQRMPVKTLLVRQRDALWIKDEIRILIEKRKIFFFTKKQNKVIEKPTGENSAKSEIT